MDLQTLAAQSVRNGVPCTWNRELTSPGRRPHVFSAFFSVRSGQPVPQGPILVSIGRIVGRVGTWLKIGLAC
jgi:hypothetical protein